LNELDLLCHRLIAKYENNTEDGVGEGGESNVEEGGADINSEGESGHDGDEDDSN
jgi:hypothetical protein